MAAWAGAESGLRPAEVRRLVAWLRAGEAKPPSLEEAAAARGDPDRGGDVYRAECAVCHGDEGEGGIGPSLRVPALGSLATDAFLHGTITEGRPGTAMPRFRELSATDLKSLIARVRGFSGGTYRPPEPVPAGDPDRGGEVHTASCAGCHGADGEGGIGPAIGKPGFWASASPGFLAASYRRGRCRDGRGEAPPAVPSGDLADAAAWLARRSARPDAPLPGRRAAGDAARGAILFGAACAGCHGERGEGKEAPALANAALLSAANDDYLRATIVRGRRGTAMPRFDRDQPGHRRLAADEIDDIVTFVRSFADEGGKKE
jgi:cytochrome c oxidase cbb3-type subunit 3